MKRTSGLKPKYEKPESLNFKIESRPKNENPENEILNSRFNLTGQMCVILTTLPLKKRVEKIRVEMAFHLVACAQLHQSES